MCDHPYGPVPGIFDGYAYGPNTRRRGSLGFRFLERDGRKPLGHPSVLAFRLLYSNRAVFYFLLEVTLGRFSGVVEGLNYSSSAKGP